MRKVRSNPVCGSEDPVTGVLQNRFGVQLGVRQNLLGQIEPIELFRGSIEHFRKGAEYCFESTVSEEKTH